MSEQQKISHDEMVRNVFNHPRALAEYKYRMDKYNPGYSRLMIDPENLFYVCEKYNLFEDSSTYPKEVDDAHRIFLSDIERMYPFITSFLQQKNLQIKIRKINYYNQPEYINAEVTQYDTKDHSIALTIDDHTNSITMIPDLFCGGEWGWIDRYNYSYRISATQDLIYEIFYRFGGFAWFVVNGSAHFPFFPLELIELIQNYVFTTDELPVSCAYEPDGFRGFLKVYRLKE
jgi:hypothetical protein